MSDQKQKLSVSNRNIHSNSSLSVRPVGSRGSGEWVWSEGADKWGRSCIEIVNEYDIIMTLHLYCTD